MKKLLIFGFILSLTYCVSAEELSLEKVKELALKASSEVESVLKKELKKIKKDAGIKGMTDFLYPLLLINSYD